MMGGGTCIGRALIATNGGGENQCIMTVFEASEEKSISESAWTVKYKGIYQAGNPYTGVVFRC